ncbi:MAG: STAS domain-containing protein [Actinobacteria bacterium]|nr:STAS domain-containing protein [Actinomycetota bacterium]
MRTSENFSCQIIKLDSELLVSLQGDLDMYAISNLQEIIWDHLTPEIKRVTIDCDWVQYVDSAFLQLVTRIANQLETVKLINASRTIRKIFEISGLSNFLTED